jgi:hypothetical protein
MLLDRVEERAAVDRLLAGVRTGLSSVLVVRGESGIGKTALLDYAAAAAADTQVVRMAAVESELGLGFAGLHQLVVPFLPRLEGLPEPQKRALRTALGLSDGPPPDMFLIGLAALTLLAGGAAERRLLILLDDAQWLDEETADVIAFAARRLRADGIGLVLSLRDDVGRPSRFEALPSLQLDGLPKPAARELLDSVVGAGMVDDEVAERLIDSTRANPLALEELAAELSAAQLAGRALLPNPLPIGAQLEARFRRQIVSLCFSPQPVRSSHWTRLSPGRRCSKRCGP